MPPTEGPDAAAPHHWRRFMPALFAIALAGILATLGFTRLQQWNDQDGWQTTDDAYTRADVTPLATKVGGYIQSFRVGDFAPVKTGDVLAQIEPADFEIAVAQADANVQVAQAAIENNQSQQALQPPTIKAADAAVRAAAADTHRLQLESARQHRLMRTDTRSPDRMERADLALARSTALLAQSRAQAEAARRQLEVLRTEERQLRAVAAAQRTILAQARLNLGYTRIVAPGDGEVGERMVRPGQLVNPGTQIITFVPRQNIWVVANFKEAQLSNVRRGQPAEVHVDSIPDMVFAGWVDRISPATESQLAQLPPDHSNGNFNKVTQRIPVRIVLDPAQDRLINLRVGLSVVARINTVPLQIMH